MMLHARRHSPFVIALVVAGHGLVLALMWNLQMQTAPLPLPALMVDIITPQPVAPEVKPQVAPKPMPMARQERPQPAPTAQPAMTTVSPAAATAVEAPAAPPKPPAVVAAPSAPSAPTPPAVDADYLDNPKPAYPALSRKLREEGKVLLRVFVEPTGLASQVEVRTSSGFERLDKSAVTAVSRWKFTPARQGTVAVAAWVEIPVVFSLN